MRMAEKAGQSSTPLGKSVASTARAAAELVGTDRARDLTSDNNLKQIKTAMEQAYSSVGNYAMRDLDKMLDNESLNKPLGSGFNDSEYRALKDGVQGYYRNLTEAGYTHDEIAAALAYDNRLVVGGSTKSARRVEPEPISLDQFLARRGLSSPISDYTLDTTRLPHGETERQRKKRIAEGQRVAREYSERRRAAIAEYEQRVSAGEFRKPTKVEELQSVARGNPDNESVQAARRLLKKRGLGW